MDCLNLSVFPGSERQDLSHNKRFGVVQGYVKLEMSFFGKSVRPPDLRKSSPEGS